MGMHLPCHKCGAVAFERCHDLRTGEPMKGEHSGARYFEIKGTTVAELIKDKRIDPS